MPTYSFCLYLILFSLTFQACQSDSVPAPDVSDIEVNLELIRYEDHILSLDPSQPVDSYVKVLGQHPNMTDLYFKRLLNMHHPQQDTFYSRISQFVSDDRIKAIGQKVQTDFKNFDATEAELTQAFKYYKYYFPKQPLPRLYTLFTEYAFQTFIFSDTEDKDAIGIGLDMFFGQDYNYKKYNPSNAAFSNYLTRSFNRDHITKKTMEIAVEDVMGAPLGKRFIDIMIHQGKKLYILEKLMPTVVDTVLHEYTPDQMRWVQENELQIWDFILEQNLMYEANNMKISKYLQPAPTSKGMPSGSPGRTGSYMGYKIVTAFMDRNKDMDIPSLINHNDAQLLLEESRFKPARK